ncbi:MAG: XamI family restriction endonuclease [Alphaproteobacteria bacterium]
MKAPPIWEPVELEREADRARELFRAERLAEPLTLWRRTYERFSSVFAELFRTRGITDPSRLSKEALAAIFRDRDLATAFRNLAGPPISEDDLRVLAETTLAPSKLARDEEAARRVITTILESIDSMRFPWVGESRPPTKHELDAAILASAALVTAQRVATKRRNTSKAQQESRLKEYLATLGKKEVQPRLIQTLDDAPLRGEFCGESKVGSRKADVCLRLGDGRLMPIECKVSNSELNSIKRINNDASVKAVRWREEFGLNQVVPTALLSGVFKTRHLMAAQEKGLALFWAHDLDRLGAFVSLAVSASRHA